MFTGARGVILLTIRNPAGKACEGRAGESIRPRRRHLQVRRRVRECFSRFELFLFLFNLILARAYISPREEYV